MAKIKSNPKLDELMSETVVVRAVDDGEGVILAAATSDVKGPYGSEVPFEHWAKGEGKQKTPSVASLKARLQDVSHVVKDKIQDLSLDVKDKAVKAGGEVKRGVARADSNLKANPYLYALGAVGVGFVLGRIFMGSRAAKSRRDVADFKDSPSQHTGVHIRRESRFASR